jgi:hypothetical protein
VPTESQHVSFAIFIMYVPVVPHVNLLTLYFCSLPTHFGSAFMLCSCSQATDFSGLVESAAKRKRGAALHG